MAQILLNQSINQSINTSSYKFFREVQNELQSDKIPFDNRNIVYTIDKDGKAGIKYVYADGKEKLIKTVSMEADYEK